MKTSKVPGRTTPCVQITPQHDLANPHTFVWEAVEHSLYLAPSPNPYHMAPGRCHRTHTSTSPCIPFACQSVSQTCSIPPVTHRPSIGQNLYHNTVSTTSMCAPPPPAKPIQTVISRLVPQATVQQVQVMPSVHCQRVYGVKVSTGASLVLVVPPPPMVKLLRSERASVVSEAAVLRWLAGKTVETPLLHEKVTETEGSPWSTSPIATYESGTTNCSDVAVQELRALVPTLISHTAATNELGLECNLVKPTLGTPISELSPPLSSAERRTVDFQTGQLYRQLCEQVSPTGRFGPAFAVLPPCAPSPATDSTKSTRRDVAARLMESRGVHTWTVAFHSMLEAVLRDGEDMQVMLGYSAIRRQFKRFEHVLDGIKTPRLVAVDVGKDVNTLVFRKRGSGDDASLVEYRPQGRFQHTDRRGSDASSEVGDEYDTGSDSGDDNASLTLQHDDGIVMAGMKDWSNFVFGDPLFALNIGREPSGDFLAGFNWSSNTRHTIISMFSSDLIEDKERAHVRLLLYDCYHTITHIARTYFRPQKDISGRELEARKRLNAILSQLDALDDAGTRRGRRPSGESSPANKRSKSGESSD
ncbi:hypothetical protein CPAR01_07582 [Colletotrichum paranaense]|uniref:Uncharacterized protein n=1 Tax=Colletotrichum paranaense TaxID=1914294 RepID=A0ABQ9SPZ6_9PEZI|nr:uncharacterized protein CPAR01_07582 [Colletotrichum paranaense]KAK1541593.1 hypothetical protein CPAR01_07582 [Colletotrichum paranaense]